MTIMGFFDLDRDREHRELVKRLNAARQVPQLPRCLQTGQPRALGRITHGRASAQPAREQDQLLPRRWGAQGQLLLDLLAEADDLRRRQQSLARVLRKVLMQASAEDHEDDLNPLQQCWAEFMAQGGVTRDDLIRVMQGQKIGARVRIKRHLRLVRSKP
jgi:hypothetical protein